MKRWYRSAFVVSIMLVAQPAFATTWALDPVHSTIGFKVRHMMVSNVNGSFEKAEGTLDYDEKQPAKSKVEVTIDVKSINTRNEKRDDDLRKGDGFFEADKFPNITFKSTKIAKDGKGYKVTGDFTLHGVTKPIILKSDTPTHAVKDPWGNLRFGLSATGKINRKDFGVTYNKLIEGGGLVIGEEVELVIDAEFTAPAPGTTGPEAAKQEASPAPAPPPAKAPDAGAK